MTAVQPCAESVGLPARLIVTFAGAIAPSGEKPSLACVSWWLLLHGPAMPAACAGAAVSAPAAAPVTNAAAVSREGVLRLILKGPRCLGHQMVGRQLTASEFAAPGSWYHCPHGVD